MPVNSALCVKDQYFEDMHQNKYKEIATKYSVQDLSGAIIPGSRLSNILTRVDSGEKNFSEIVLNYLKQQGLLALLQYAKKEITFTEFQALAKLEQPDRRLANEAKQKEQLAQQELKRNAISAKIEERQRITKAKRKAFENTPRYKDRVKLNNLKNKYGLDFFIEVEDFSTIMNIIRKVDRKTRLSEEDIVWLTTEGEEYFTSELKEAYHKNEAKYYANKFKKSKNAWFAVNASSHYRKCYQTENSLTLLDQINLSKIRNKHQKSAICTTKGGCMRDLSNFQKAIQLAKEAHNYDTKSFHPCTLLGAVNYELGHFTEGDIWFKKAEKRGASVGSVDHELRSIFKRADKKKKEKLRQHLLNLDPYQYSWARDSGK